MTGKSYNKINITLIKSTNGLTAKHKACVSGLGLRRIGHSVAIKDTPENRGMINKIGYLLTVDEGINAPEYD